MEKIRRDALTEGGFAGLRETRLVIDPRAFTDPNSPGVWSGLGNFVYLADARFEPHGETRMHSHKEIDVISVMVEGRIAHQGSLEHGRQIEAPEIQVQRAGGQGFSHNEVNPDDTRNRLIQLWVLPETAGETAGYRLYRPALGTPMRIYGGPAGQDETFAAATRIDVAVLEPGQRLDAPGDYLAYVVRGDGHANDVAVAEGDLLRGNNLAFRAAGPAQLILVQNDP